MWQAFIQTQESRQGVSPLMSAVMYQSRLSKKMIEMLIPIDYKDNCFFWEMKCNSRYYESTLLHLVFGYSLSNVCDRLKLLNELIPNESWQRMLINTNTYGLTPLMYATMFSPEMDDKIMSYLIPTNLEMSFWKFTVNEKPIRTKGCNVIHLSIMNEKYDELNILNCLKCLRSKMREEMWQELLKMKNTMVLKETPVEMARRLKKSNEVIDELT